jgi:hypothetical protein
VILTRDLPVRGRACLLPKAPSGWIGRPGAPPHRLAGRPTGSLAVKIAGHRSVQQCPCAPMSINSSRACWATHAPVGFAVTPASHTRPLWTARHRKIMSNGAIASRRTRQGRPGRGLAQAPAANSVKAAATQRWAGTSSAASWPAAVRALNPAHTLDRIRLAPMALATPVTPSPAPMARSPAAELAATGSRRRLWRRGGRPGGSAATLRAAFGRPRSRGAAGRRALRRPGRSGSVVRPVAGPSLCGQSVAGARP